MNSQVVAVFSHDAGGAEILSSYISQNIVDARYVISGPAVGIFKRKIDDIKISEAEEAVMAADWVLCGTGWQSDLEWQGIRLAREFNKKSIAFLDHWVNYKPRFIRNNKLILPDEIWVGDEYAFTLAREIFKTVRIKQISNPYHADFVRSYKKVVVPQKYRNKSRLLFISDNIEESLKTQFGNGALWGYTDADSLEYLIQNIEKIDSNVTGVTIRSHPSEKLNNFLWLINKYTGFVAISDNDLLIDDLVTHDIVVGSESMAMVIALLCGKNVVSSIPPGGKECALPHSGIKILRDL